MTDYITRHRLKVATALQRFIDDQVLPGTGLHAEAFWEGFADLVHELAPLSRDLLAERERLAALLNDWTAANPAPRDPGAWRDWLIECGYLHSPPAQVRVSSANLDLEISDLAGPQLLVEGTDRAALLDAQQARWGSLYDALYQSDADQHRAPATSAHDPQRLARVVVQVRELLDRFVPLAVGSHIDARRYRVRQGQLSVRLARGEETALRSPEHYLGHRGNPDQPDAVLLRHHGLHLELRFDPQSPAGGGDIATLADVRLETALTALVDITDPLPTVDAAGPLKTYGNWLALMTDTLASEPSTKDRARPVPAHDLRYQGSAGGELLLPARPLLALHVNALQVNGPALLDVQGNPVSQLIVDATLGSLIGLHDRQRRGNSRTGSLYLNVPNLQGCQEAAFVQLLCQRIETLLELPEYTLKLGLVDEHWRTSLNLEACLQAIAPRLALLRGPLEHARPAAQCPAWQATATQRRRAVAMACGLRGRVQLGVGPWSPLQPDERRQALHDGIGTGLVDTPLAATLHALDYHEVDVRERQAGLESQAWAERCTHLLQNLLDQTPE
ncbi:malate synthase G [uncultured Pseudomonas sp.]|uniref:malate synthase G n=1 Tax=uncultured Pseudomonas sp. TaxID=114707 RepID=UPI0025E9BD9C|nr:malate synthase G [uncultured Pseudomonas sp.]